MKPLFVSLLLLMAGIAFGELAPPERSYKILMLLPASSKSHRNVFMPIAEALADRGHKVVMITNHNKPSQHPNIHEVSHGLPDFDSDSINMFEQMKEPNAGLGLFKTALPALARKLYKIPKIKEIYDKRKQFDLVVINHMFNELAYPFAYEMPFITIATPGMDLRQSAVLGNPISPAYFPIGIGSFDLSSVLGRLLSTMTLIILSIYWRNWAIVPAIQKEITAQFPDLPPLLEIERNQSLTFLNSHFSMDIPFPLLPSQVEVGALHCRPPKPLPEDIKSWIDGAGSAGVIYFSLGSIARGDTMPTEYRDMFIEAFKKLDQRILWKFERELEGVSKNVKISHWLPQQDILAHPNVKVFITHGGLLSMQEASFHGTPLLALPIFAEQPKNAQSIASNGLGLYLKWDQLTVDSIVESLREIMNNPKYKQTASAVSKLNQDQLTSPVDRAIYWTEYIIRHQGAPKLRSPAAGLSWAEFLLLDVAALFLLIVIILLLIVQWVFKKILRAIFGKSESKRKRE